MCDHYTWYLYLFIKILVDRGPVNCDVDVEVGLAKKASGSLYLVAFFTLSRRAHLNHNAVLSDFIIGSAIAPRGGAT